MSAMRLDGYIRVSRVGGRKGDSFISPAEQREKIAQWAALRGVEIAEWHTDLDQTGGKMDRPGLDAALARVCSGETGGIAVARLDRFSRAGVAEALKVVEQIHECSGEIAAVDLGIDPTTPVGEFAMTLMLGLGRMQRRQIGEGWQSAKSRAVSRGVHFQAPFGYSKGEDGRLVPNDHAPLVRELFQRRARGDSWAELVRWLNSTGAKPTRARQWTHGTLLPMIRNRAYLGEAYNSGQTFKDAHPALVTTEEFAAANEARGVVSRNGDGALLSGLIRCAGCRHRMTINYGGEGHPKRAYRCRGSHGSGDCPAPSVIRASVIEPFVEEAFLAHYGDVEVEGSKSSAELTGAAERVAAAERELDAFAGDPRIREALGHDRYVAQMEARARELQDAQDALNRVRVAASGVDLPNSAIWPELTTAEKRRLLADGIDCIFSRKIGNAPVSERAHIFWRGEGPNDLPGRNLPMQPIRSLDW